MKSLSAVASGILTLIAVLVHIVTKDTQEAIYWMLFAIYWELSYLGYMMKEYNER